MRKIFLLAFIFLPLVAQAQTLNQEQAVQIGNCLAPFTQKQINGQLTTAQYQWEMILCYRAVGAGEWLPVGLRDAASVTEVEQYLTGAMATVKQIDQQENLGLATIQEKLKNAPPLSAAEGQKINTCIEQLAPQLKNSAQPSAAAQRAIADCFRGTAYESLVTPLYEKIAVLVERATPVATAASLLILFATIGRDIGPLLFLLFWQLRLIFRRIPVEQTGLVVNSLTHAPVDLSIIRLLQQERVFRSTVSDKNGRFFLVAPAGQYGLLVVKPGWHWPATNVDNLTAIFSNTHSVPMISLPAEQPVVQKTLPLEPTVTEPSIARVRWARAARGFGMFVQIGSPTVGASAAVLTQKWWVIILAVTNLLTLGLFLWWRHRQQPPAMGKIQNAANQPVANAVVRLFENQYNKLVATAVSDSGGRFGLMVGPGNFTVRAEKNTVGTAEKSLTFLQTGVITDTLILK